MTNSEPFLLLGSRSPQAGPPKLRSNAVRGLRDGFGSQFPSGEAGSLAIHRLQNPYLKQYIIKERALSSAHDTGGDAQYPPRSPYGYASCLFRMVSTGQLSASATEESQFGYLLHVRFRKDPTSAADGSQSGAPVQ